MDEEYTPPTEILHLILQILAKTGNFSDECLVFVENALSRASEPEAEPSSYKTPIPQDLLAEIRETSPWLNRAGAASYLGVDEKTIDRLRERGRLPEYRPDDMRCPRFLREDLDRTMLD